MAIDGLSAWLIHRQVTGETSYRLTLFTRDKGMVWGRYRGGRGLKKQSVIQPFLPLWIAVAEQPSGILYIQNVESVAAPIPLQGISLFAALYLNELLYHVIKPGDPQPELYECYGYTIQALSSQQERRSIEALLRRFEWQLLDACGVLCSFENDAYTHEPIAADKQYRFQPDAGFIAVECGLSGADILAFADGQLTEPAVLKTGKLIMRHAIDSLLGGRTLTSRQLFSVQPNHPHHSSDT